MLTRADLQRAVSDGILSQSQADAVWQITRSRSANAGVARFTVTHALYYLGGLIAIGALSLFMTLAWERIGASALLATAAAYGAIAYFLAALLERRGYALPAGIIATLVIVVIPLGVYAIQHMLGLWADARHAQAYRHYHEYVDWRWIVMELATLAGGAAMLWRFRYAFLVMPIAVTLWYMGMDLAPFLAGGVDEGSSALWELRKWISIAMGMATLGLAVIVDLRNRSPRDFAFWLYLFGLASFWGGLTMLESHGLPGKLVYLAINIGLILIGAVLLRRAFAVFGGIGVAIVLGDISRTYFKDSFAFTIVLTLIGLAIIGAGLLWQRHEQRISRSLRSLLPPQLRELVERRSAA